MVRKAVIIVLTLGAVLAAYENVASYRRLIDCGWALGDSDVVSFLTKTGSLTFRHIHSVKGVPGMIPRCLVENVPNVYGHFKLNHLWTVEFTRRAIPTPPGGRRFEIEFPLGFATVALAAYPIIAFIGGPVRRWRRRKRGLCVRCGYNLAGNVSGVCPECGEAACPVHV